LFLVDTNVISEIRKGPRADVGVIGFLRDPDNEIFLPVQVIGELRRGVQNVLRKGDAAQAAMLEAWFQRILEEFSKRILVFDLDCAQTWGRLAGFNEQNLIDKQIAAIAIVYDLTLVTRNTNHFSGIGVRLLNPFTSL
jgi:predicted nucleic acid-binding protein